MCVCTTTEPSRIVVNFMYSHVFFDNKTNFGMLITAAYKLPSNIDICK